MEGIIYSEEDNPHEILGPHAVSKNTLFQTFQPEAEEVYLILSDQKKKKMEQVDEAGFFACLMPGRIPDKLVQISLVEEVDYQYPVKREGIQEKVVGGGGIAVEGCYHNLVYCQRLLVFVAFWQPWLTSGVGSDEYRGECQCDGCKYGAGVCHGEVIV